MSPAEVLDTLALPPEVRQALERPQGHAIVMEELRLAGQRLEALMKHLHAQQRRLLDQGAAKREKPAGSHSPIYSSTEGKLYIDHAEHPELEDTRTAMRSIPAELRDSLIERVSESAVTKR